MMRPTSEAFLRAELAYRQVQLPAAAGGSRRRRRVFGGRRSRYEAATAATAPSCAEMPARRAAAPGAGAAIHDLPAACRPTAAA